MFDRGAPIISDKFVLFSTRGFATAVMHTHIQMLGSLRAYAFIFINTYLLATWLVEQDVKLEQSNQEIALLSCLASNCVFL